MTAPAPTWSERISGVFRDAVGWGLADVAHQLPPRVAKTVRRWNGDRINKEDARASEDADRLNRQRLNVAVTRDLLGHPAAPNPGLEAAWPDKDARADAVWKSLSGLSLLAHDQKGGVAGVTIGAGGLAAADGADLGPQALASIRERTGGTERQAQSMLDWTCGMAASGKAPHVLPGLIASPAGDRIALQEDPVFKIMHFTHYDSNLVIFDRWREDRGTARAPTVRRAPDAPSTGLVDGSK